MSCWEGYTSRETRIKGKKIIYSVQIEICEIKDYDSDFSEVLKQQLALPKVNISGAIYLGGQSFSIQVLDDDPSGDSLMGVLKS